MSSVHNFTKDISQVVPRHLIVLGQIVKQDVSANSKITVIKVVNSRPSLRTELFTSKHNGVEEAKCEQTSFKFDWFFIAFI